MAILIIALIHCLCSQNSDWERYKWDMETNYISWSKKYGIYDKKAFLDHQLNDIGEPKSRKDIRKALYIVAMYHEWNKDVPRWLKGIIDSKIIVIKNIKINNNDIMLFGIAVKKDVENIPDAANKEESQERVSPLNLELLERAIFAEVKKYNKENRENDMCGIVDPEFENVKPIKEAEFVDPELDI